jgi:indole-3-glycerol phosphate synthase
MDSSRKKAEAQAGGVLGAILGEVRQALEARHGELGEWERRARAAPAPPDFGLALRGSALALVAEVKRRSPSAGDIRPGADAVDVARAYVAGGAAAISVLTEPRHFGGSLADLQRVAAAVGLPVLRKDFIIDPLQVFEARAMGAAAVLLIVRALEQQRLLELAGLARRLGMASLVEVHAEAELARALEASPTAIGINSRDLETLEVDERPLVLLPRVPLPVLAIAESGIVSRKDVERTASLGADAVLVGTSLASAQDPEQAVRGLVGVKRREEVRR